MRSVLIMICMIWTGNIAIAQEKVPLKVKTALYLIHPTMEGVQWEVKTDVWVAAYQGPHGPTQVFFNDEGQWLELRVRKSFDELPENVNQLVRSRYRTAEIAYAGRLERPDGFVAYRIESELPSGTVVKLISLDGKFLEKEWIDSQISDSPDPSLPSLQYKKVNSLMSRESKGSLDLQD